MGFETALQETIKDTLDNAAGLSALIQGVYDNVPQPDDGGSSATFPYVVIGEDDFQDWSTDTESGAEGTVTIHSWSRYRGRKEIKDIQGEVYSALHRATLAVTGYDFITCDFLSSNSLVDQDGFTRHGIQTFRVLIDAQ